MRHEPQLSILVLASEPNIAAEVAFRARGVGCVVFAPRPGESAAEAAFRLRPEVVLVQAGHAELIDEHMTTTVRGLGAGLMEFTNAGRRSIAIAGVGSQDVVPRLSLATSDGELLSAIRAASSSIPAAVVPKPVTRSRLVVAWAKRSSRNRAARSMTA